MTESFDPAQGFPENSEGAVHAHEEYKQVVNALNRSDANELFVLYKRAVTERGEAFSALATAIKHFSGGSELPRIAKELSENVPPENVIGSMERVALAAIELARAIAIKD
jgi:hypothetical protein